MQFRCFFWLSGTNLCNLVEGFIFSRGEFEICKFSFYFILCIAASLKKEVLKIQKRNILANPNNFYTKIFITF